MDQIMNYVKPELIVVAVALYFIGMALKQAQSVKDKYIPRRRKRRADLWATELCSICGRREKYAKRGCDHHRRRSVVRSTRATVTATDSEYISG